MKMRAFIIAVLFVWALTLGSCKKQSMGNYAFDITPTTFDASSTYYVVWKTTNTKMSTGAKASGMYINEYVKENWDGTIEINKGTAKYLYISMLKQKNGQYSQIGYKIRVYLDGEVIDFESIKYSSEFYCIE